MVTNPSTVDHKEAIKKEIFKAIESDNNSNSALQLGEKIGGLNKGLQSDGFAQKVGDYQFELLNLQHGAMITYRRVLIMRIKDLTK